MCRRCQDLREFVLSQENSVTDRTINVGQQRPSSQSDKDCGDISRVFKGHCLRSRRAAPSQLRYMSDHFKNEIALALGSPYEGRTLVTDEWGDWRWSLRTPEAVGTLQRKLYGKAKTEPAFRFYPLRQSLAGGQAMAQRPVHSHAEAEPAVGAARQTIEELSQALLAFRKRYNATCLIERYRFFTAMVKK
jgi:hypothetical protein